MGYFGLYLFHSLILTIPAFALFYNLIEKAGYTFCVKINNLPFFFKHFVAIIFCLLFPVIVLLFIIIMCVVTSILTDATTKIKKRIFTNNYRTEEDSLRSMDEKFLKYYLELKISKFYVYESYIKYKKLYMFIQNQESKKIQDPLIKKYTS